MNAALSLLAALIVLQAPPPLPSVVPVPSPPPLVPMGEPILPPPGNPVFAPRPQPMPGPVAPLPPLRPLPPDAPAARGAIHFVPLSVFILYLGVEGELAFADKLTAFVGLGGGLLGQLTAEAGVRLYPVERVLDGLFVDLHGQTFLVPATSLVMLGPGAELGWAFKTSGRLLMTVGVGANLWFSVANKTASASILGSLGGSPWADVFVFPGVNIPMPNQPAVQPTVRLTIGPSF